MCSWKGRGGWPSCLPLPRSCRAAEHRSWHAPCWHAAWTGVQTHPQSQRGPCPICSHASACSTEPAESPGLPVPCTACIPEPGALNQLITCSIICHREGVKFYSSCFPFKYGLHLVLSRSPVYGATSVTPLRSSTMFTAPEQKFFPSTRHMQQPTGLKIN